MSSSKGWEGQLNMYYNLYLEVQRQVVVFVYNI